MNRQSALLRRVALALCGVVIFMAYVTAQAVWTGERAMRQSDSAFHQGRVEVSLDRARSAAVAYAPGAPHVSSAYERIQAIARGAERRGQFELALSAWRALRGALLETRHPFRPKSDLLETANGHIARLQAHEVVDRGNAQHELEQLLNDSSRPRTGRLSLLAAGFLGVLAGLVGFGLWAVSSSGALRRGPALACSVVAACGLLSWVLALFQA